MSTQFRSRTLAVAAVMLFLAAPAAVEAAYTSAVAGSVATMAGDAAGDTLTITQAGGLFQHNRFTAGDPSFSSSFDFNTAVAGDQTVSATTGIIVVNAGDGNDSIVLGDGINLRGAVDGGPGTDTLDYSAYTTAVGANLGLGTTGLTATLGADQENPPTTHAGTATATVTNYSITTHTFDINVTVTGLLPGDVTGFHIHQASVGVNGPIIVDFTGVAPLIPVGTGFTFTATGLTLPSANEAAFLGGGTYVNIHTATFPGGAIRGQLFSGGNVNLAGGTATGTTGVANIENVTGGPGNDSLVGNFTINTINGGAGADWIVGGPGNDTQNGGAGADVMVWSNGDGSDVNEGGSESDTVQVNGSTAAADVFLVSANGTRLRFDRTNLGLFNLDIGTTETLTVNGIGGDDSFTVNNLTDVASLTTVNLRGFDGNDTFVYVPTSAGAFVVNAHGGPGTDTLQGPNGTSTWNVTAANQGNVTGPLVTSFSFIETLAGGSASDTFNVKAFATGTPTTVTGGAGTDTLIYNAESRPISGDTTPPDGVIDSPGVQSVTFTQIETVNITNPQPTIAISDVTVSEQPSPANAVFNVSLTNTSSLTVTVNFATADGTATAPNDYSAQSGTLTFAPGETLKTISVPVTSDGFQELTETFVVNLSGAVNAAIADAQGQGSITNAPIMSIDKTALTFTAVTTGAEFSSQTAAQTIRLTQAGPGTVTWTAASTAPWLVVSPTSGSGTATLTISVQFASGLAATQSGNVTLTFTGAGNTAGPIVVTLNTISSSVAPTGAFDTPTNGATGVAGSIAVTGWAIDDVQVTRVAICRDAVPGESAPPHPACNGLTQVFIGDGAFVEGARPDIQALFPNHPLNTRAGWGYLMLTNFLPDLGNGTFTLHAYASDADGHTTSIGSTTITCTNATSIAPFGAIDTPNQGETISGGAYINFGWALSPGTRRADVPGGGTVQVLIDGTNVGTPGGWVARPDLTSLFPIADYSGVDNAAAAFIFDTTALTNGVHTIAWVVTATSGGTSGVGSRFFGVSNGALFADPSQSGVRSAPTNVIASAATLEMPREAALRMESPLTLALEIDLAPADVTTIHGRRGFDLTAPLREYAAADGRVTVQAEELDRIELLLSDTGGHQYTGYLRTIDGVAPLPVGSTLDAATGAFTWMLGVGFIGNYNLVFVRWNGDRPAARQDVRIVIGPKGSNRVGPQIIVDAPTENQVVERTFLLGGWAADLNDTIGTGVDTVHVWAYRVNAEGRWDDPVFLGSTIYGGARPDVAAIYGARVRNSGYGIIVQDLAPGTYDIAVFAYSTVTDSFGPAKTVRVTVR
jgi:hypothetical protein